jgi:hypothetical protein
MSPTCGVVQRRVALGVGRLQVRPLAQQQLRNGCVAKAGGKVQGRALLAVLAVDILGGGGSDVYSVPQR